MHDKHPADQERTLKDPELLAEAFTDREALEETSTPQEIKALIQQTEAKKETAYQAIQHIFETKKLDQAPLALYRYRYYEKFLMEATQKLTTS